MKNKGLIIGILVLLIAIGGYFVWQQKADKQDEKDNENSIIKIGAVIPLTGKVATYGQSLKEGFDMAVEEEKSKFQIIYEDSKADNITGINAISKLINVDNVNFVFGDATSGVMLAIAPIAEKNKVILFDAIATSDEISKSGDYVFMSAPSNYKQAITAANFIIDDLKISKIATIYNQTDYGVNLSIEFKKYLSKKEVNLVFESSYQDGTTNFTSILSKLKDSEVEAVFTPSNYEVTAILLKQAREMGITIPFIGTDGAYSPKLIEIAGDATANFYITMMGVDTNNSLYKEFVKKYQNQYNKQPNIFTAYGYEAAKILFKSILESGDNSNKVKDYLYNNTFDSFTGKLKFDKDGEVSRGYVIMKVENKKFVNQ